MKKFLLTALLASAIAAPAGAAELVTNGGFENDFVGWFITDNGLNLSPTAHSGNKSAITIATESQGGDSLGVTLSTVVGQIYTVSYWVAALSSEPAHGVFQVYWDNQLVQAYYDDVNTYGFVNIINMYVATKTSTELTFYAYSDLGLYQLDDVSVTGPIAGDGGGDTGGGVRSPVPEPATWAMMLLGFGLMGGTLRRRRAQAAFA